MRKNIKQPKSQDVLLSYVPLYLTKFYKLFYKLFVQHTSHCICVLPDQTSALLQISHFLKEYYLQSALTLNIKRTRLPLEIRNSRIRQHSILLSVSEIFQLSSELTIRS